MSDWFLPASTRPWSEGNTVIPRVHGASYFQRLVEVIGGTAAGDEVCFTDWRGDADQLLADGGPTVAELFGDAAGRGVQIRGLLWRSHSDHVSFSAQQNALLDLDLNDAGGVGLLDERVRRGGSHHQKVVVVRHPRRQQDYVAFVGGIDLCHSRRDDARHNGDAQCQPMDERYGRRPPWHDATLELRGPAVAHVHDCFVERWNDPTPLDHRNPYRRWRQRKADMPRHPEPLVTPPPPPTTGLHQVQVLRTYGDKRPGYPFAAGGERTIALAYERAFSRAQRLVYIEDQYLWSAVVAKTLAEALRRTPALQVIAVVPRYPDADGATSGPPNRLGQIAAMRLLGAAGGARFGVYDLQNAAGTPIYVHAKVCIVDDVWMACGSDNFNRRSWTHDSELTCAVVDPEGILASSLREELWSEHLGIPLGDPRLDDLDHAQELWLRAAQAGTGQARVHEPEPVSGLQRLWAHPLQRLVYDPDGRSLRARKRHRF